MIICEHEGMIANFVSLQQGYPPNTSWGNYNALGLLRNGRLVAGVIYNSYEEGNVCMHVAASPGVLTRKAIFAAFDYPFNQLGKRRVTAMIPAKNKKAIAFNEGLGFKYEGTMRHYFNDDDALIYGMLREDCRFLNMRKAA